MDNASLAVALSRPSKRKSLIRCVSPAPQEAVMMEQLQFLIAHAGKGRHQDCGLCRRLDRVKPLLLAAFA